MPRSGSTRNPARGFGGTNRARGLRHWPPAPLNRTAATAATKKSADPRYRGTEPRRSSHRHATAGSVPAHRLQGGRCNRLGGDAELPVEILVRSAGPEACHADEGPVAADDLVPALAHRGLDRDPHGRVADDGAPHVGR